MLIDRADTVLPVDETLPALKTPEPEKPSEDVTFFDSLGPAFRQHNIIGSVYQASKFMPEDQRYDPEYVPFDGIAGTKYEPYYEDFVDLPNKKAELAKKAQIDAEEDDQKTLDAAGWAGTGASFLASLADLPTLIPGGGLISSVGRPGYSVARTALQTGLLAGAATTAQETVLQGSQVTRSKAGSAFAIGGSVVLGALVGGVGAKIFSGIEYSRLAKALGSELNKVAELAPDTMQKQGEKVIRDLSAAFTEKDGLDDLTIAGKAAGMIANKTANLNPLLRGLTSPSSVVREIAGKLMENPLYLKKNARGKASEAAVETIVKEYQGATVEATIHTREMFKQARKNGFIGSYGDFRDRIGRAMRRNDVDLGGSEEVTKAAQNWRAKVFDPLKEEAITLKRLPDDVKVETAASYFSRVYNIEKIEAQEQRFLQITRNWLGQQLIEIENKGGAVGQQFASKADRDQYIEDIARNIYDKLTGRDSVGQIPHTIVATDRGPLKERTFSIPDELIEDFLVDDIERVGQRYARIMGAEVELTRKFGDSDLTDTIKEVQDSFRDLRDKIAKNEKIEPAARERMAQHLSDRERADVKDIQAVRDMLRGTYQVSKNHGAIARILQGAQAFNYIRLMGGVVLSSLTDIARPMMVHGLMPFLRDGIKPLVSNIKAFKASSREARLAGTLGERWLHNRLAGWAELTDPYATGSPAERMLQNMARGFSTVSGISLWTDFMKAIASGMTQTRILRGVSRYAELGEKEKRYLAYLGIDEQSASRLAKEFETHGSIDGDVHIAGTEGWTDDVARRSFRAALNKDVDSIIVTKGIGDVPLFSHTPTGRALLQFKSFALASHQRAFMRGLQEGNAGVLSGTMLSTIIGMFIYWAKAAESNRLDKMSDNPGTWVAEGLDRSGLFTVLFEANNIAEKIGIPGIYAGLGEAGQVVKPNATIRTRASRYGSRSIAQSMMGPTFGLTQDVAQSANAALTGNLGKGDVTTAFGLLPLRTLPFIRSVLDYYAIPEAKETVEQ